MIPSDRIRARGPRRIEADATGATPAGCSRSPADFSERTEVTDEEARDLVLRLALGEQWRDMLAVPIDQGQRR